MPKVNVNLNYDGPEVERRLTRWIPRQVMRRFDYESSEREKLIAMAREAASKLRLDDWNIHFFDDDPITMEVLRIIASSSEVRESECRLRVAWQLASHRTITTRARKYVFKYLRETDTEVSRTYKLQDTAKIREQLQIHLFKFVRNRWSASELSNALLCLIRSVRAKGLYALHRYCAHRSNIPFPYWADSLIEVYRKAWWSAIDDIRDLMIDDCLESRLDKTLDEGYEMEYEVTRNEVNRMEDETSEEKDRGIFYLGLYLDCLAVVTLAIQAEIPLDSSEFRLYKLPYVPKSLAVPFLIGLLLHEFVGFVCSCFTNSPKVGKTTNRLRLRCKHLLNKGQVEDRQIWDVFEASLSSLSTESWQLKKPEKMNYDLFPIMQRTLCAQEHKVADIQASIVNRVLGSDSFEKNTLLGRLSRRHVRMLHCGKGGDRALVIPYLNTIFLDITDEHWIRDYDFESLQPCKGEYDGGKIRRAANILCALEFPTGKEAVVNQIVQRRVLELAKIGELFTSPARNVLLSVMHIKERVSILALKVVAREVFDNDKNMECALVREMIHDRLFVRSEFKPKYREQSLENDAYYHAFYLSQSIVVNNNIWWGDGVPLCGMYGLFVTGGNKSVTTNAPRTFTPCFTATDYIIALIPTLELRDSHCVALPCVNAGTAQKNSSAVLSNELLVLCNEQIHNHFTKQGVIWDVNLGRYVYLEDEHHEYPLDIDAAVKNSSPFKRRRIIAVGSRHLLNPTAHDFEI